jgi:hypothetical protein
MCLRCLGMKHDWNDGDKKRWSRLFVYAIVLLVLTRSSVNILFRDLFFMNFILMTKYTLSIEFVHSASTRRNNQSTLYRKSWVFSGNSGFLPQGILTGWVKELAPYNGLFLLILTPLERLELHGSDLSCVFRNSATCSSQPQVWMISTPPHIGEASPTNDK